MIRRFAGMLALQLIKNSKWLGASSSHFLPEDDLNEVVPLVGMLEPSQSGVLDLSSPDLPLQLRKILLTPSKMQMEEPTTW